MGGDSCVYPDPTDDGGCDALANIRYDGPNGIFLRFHAYDEYLTLTRVGTSNAVTVYVNYTPKGSSTTYNYKYSVNQDKWSQQLGSDGDLNEGGHIEIGMCTLLNTCSGVYWGTT
jgi:hypothetical protein